MVLENVKVLPHEKKKDIKALHIKLLHSSGKLSILKKYGKQHHTNDLGISLPILQFCNVFM